MFRAVFLCFLILGLKTFPGFSEPSNDKKENHPSRQKITPENIEHISIVGVGDIMPGTDFPSSRYLPPGNDCEKLFSDVKSFLTESDITTGNLEGAIAGEYGEPKGCKDITQCFVFRIPEQYANCLKNTGFDLLGIANNHAGDFGYEGRLNTIRILQKEGIGFAGIPSHSKTIIETNDIKIGFCAFSPHSGTCNLKDYDYVRKIIGELDKEADLIVVSFHGGAEGKDHQFVTREDEVYLGFNRGNVYEFAHAAIDAGADLILGHGPHVTRAIELYKNRLICYSLGNFCTYARFNLRGPNGIAPIINVRLSKTGEFIQGRIIPIKQTGEGIPKFDPDGAAIKKIIELTKHDFPETPLIISSDGDIFLK